ncbi:hypothetical protein ACLB2K_030854 [Fragaria x ananassa]
MSNSSSSSDTKSSSDASSSDFSRTFKYLLATQLCSRGIPFIVNAVILRNFLKVEDFALYGVQFPLFVNCVLFLSREGFRRACLRQDMKSDGSSTEENIAKIMKFAWLVPPCGIIITTAASGFVFWWKGLSFSDPYGKGILITGGACILELLAEPLYILSQNLLLLKLRLAVETAATFFRCITTAILFGMQVDMEKEIIFALSQTAYGMCLFLGYWVYFLRFRPYRSSALFPFREKDKKNYDGELLKMCELFALQSCVKLILQEGQNFVLLQWATYYNQAVYGFVDNLGSLVVRMVFLPFEESTYATFARSASGKDPDKDKRLGSSLTEALKLVMLIGLIFMAFGPSYAYSLIRLVYGQKWSDGEASTALGYYCFYIIVLAMNGTSEAFVHAVAKKNQLLWSNLPSVLITIIYVVLNILLVNSAGAVGLILANSLNMILRIIYSGAFIKHYFQDSSSFSFYKCLPEGWKVLLFSGITTIISERIFLDRKNFWATFVVHFTIGVACFCTSAFVIYRHERSLINRIIPINKIFPSINRIVRFRDHSD